MKLFKRIARKIEREEKEIKEIQEENQRKVKKDFRQMFDDLFADDYGEVK